jgi:methylmalonyl-CoA mutase N-terminal domain/subunit
LAHGDTAKTVMPTATSTATQVQRQTLTVLRVDPEAEQRQLAGLATFKERRDQAAVEAKLEQVRQVA